MIILFSNSIVFLDKIISIKKNQYQTVNFHTYEYQIILNYVDGSSSVINFESIEERDKKYDKLLKEITEKYGSIKI
jgi:hypothetical protein